MNCGCRIALVMVLVTAGCGQDARLSEIDAMIDRHVVGLLDAEGPRQGTNEVLGEGLKKIESLSNDVAQVGCMTAWADRILAARIDATDYHLWSRRINVVPSQIEGIVAGIRRSHADVEQVFDLRLRLLEWYQEELWRLKPTRRIDPHDGNYGEDRIWWQDCYERTFVSYRSFVNRMEMWWYPDETKDLPEAMRGKIRHKIERCLGRAMRTEAEARADRNWETDEYKAVRLHSVGP